MWGKEKERIEVTMMARMQMLGRYVGNLLGSRRRTSQGVDRDNHIWVFIYGKFSQMHKVQLHLVPSKWSSSTNINQTCCAQQSLLFSFVVSGGAITPPCVIHQRSSVTLEPTQIKCRNGTRRSCHWIYTSTPCKNRTRSSCHWIYTTITFPT